LKYNCLTTNLQLMVHESLAMKPDTRLK